MLDRLRKVVDATREELGEAVAEAEAELASLRAKERELLSLIEEARRLLGSADGSSRVGPMVSERPRTLHGAMKLVLSTAGEDGLTGRQLAGAINQQQLYRKRDGTAVRVNQIHARAHNYPHIFEKRGGQIRLRSERTTKVTASHAQT